MIILREHVSRRGAAREGRPYIVLLLLVFIAFCFLAGCKTSDDKNAKRYELSGKVVSFDRKGHTITIAHDDIAGYMPAMTMPFTARDEWVYTELAEGDRIQATLAIAGTKSWLEDIVISRTEATPSSNPGTLPHLPEPGEEPPGFSLVNQDGKQINTAQYRGRALLLTFIYTRCPVPDYCPLMTSNLAAIARMLNADESSRVHLLSVTVDPTYDSPKVLREYGTKAGANFDRWEFAGGTADQVKAIAEWFGMSYWPENGQIIHSLSTALIGRDGKVVKFYRGNGWKVEEVFADMRSLIAREKA